MRGSLGFFVILLIYALKKLFNPSAFPKGIEVNTDEEKMIVETLVRGSPYSNAYLALTGDKRFFFDTQKQAFLMYQIQGKCWIVLGEVIGAEAAKKELLWSFYEACDRYRVLPVFYQISEKNISPYLEMGLSFLKLGEEAKVDLKKFSLIGGAMKSLRQSVNRLSKEYSFHLLESSQVLIKNF